MSNEKDRTPLPPETAERLCDAFEEALHRHTERFARILAVLRVERDHDACRREIEDIARQALGLPIEEKTTR
jgi:hypothetical protein